MYITIADDPRLLESGPCWQAEAAGIDYDGETPSMPTPR
jgi:hypothetical protein